MRRINPRGQPVAGQGTPAGSNNTHRVTRRRMPYGPVYDPAQSYDGIERGLLGYFINSTIENQYEFVLGEWVNKGRVSRFCPAKSQVERPNDCGPGS
jgi:deferrochelatase/peroxidase EfeB